MTGPNATPHEDALVRILQDRIKSLIYAYDFYALICRASQIRAWEELLQWSTLATLYVKSQALLIDQLTVKRPGRSSLVKTVEYAHKHAEFLSDGKYPNRARQELGRVSIGVFTAEEAEKDLVRIRAARNAITFCDIEQPGQLHDGFEARVMRLGGSEDDGFRIPDYPEIELAIDALFEIWLKYCEVFLGQNYSRVSVMPRRPLDSYSSSFAIAGDWNATQFDPKTQSPE